MSRYRYGAYDGGPDPLAPPFDAGSAMDDLGASVLSGRSVREALDELLRRGRDQVRGLDALRERLRRRRSELAGAGRLDGLLDDVRQLLQRAVDAERAALFADPSDDARFREMRLDALPDSSARAVRELREYDWRSPQARAAYEELLERLRRDVIDQQFAGLTQGLAGLESPEARAALAQMMGDLNALLDAHRRGEDVQGPYEEFKKKHRDFFPDAAEDFSDFLDDLARRAAAAQRLMDSLTPEQRAELAALTRAALDDLDLAAQMAQLTDSLRAARPDLQWSGAQQMGGSQGLGLPDATAALADLADLEAIESQLGDRWGSPALDDIDVDAVERALGRGAADDVAALRAAERALREQGYLTDRLDLTPKALRRIGMAALRRVFDQVEAGARGGHDTRSAGAAGELTGHTRSWQFGDEQPLDVVRTLGNATRRQLATGGRLTPGTRLDLQVEDFEVHETEARSRAAVALLVDRSFSMVVNDTWVPAKITALALHTLASMAYPLDAIQLISFANVARVVAPTELPTLAAGEVQGTNLQHGLMLASAFFDRHRDAERIAMVVTDGEPTAHLLPDGDWWFDWPPAPETIALTVAEVDRLTRRGVTISWFQLGDEPRLTRFLDAMARRNGGRVLAADGARLGEYVVSDYVRARGRRGGR